MPKIIRWFRVTQDINQDPEMWELRETFGDRAGFVWLEMLSIADRNNGIVGAVDNQTRNQLASKCRTSRVKVELILDWCRVKGWLVSDSRWRVAKWLKYNGSRKSIADSPSHDSPRLLNKTSLTAVDNLEISKEKDPEWKPISDRIFNSNPTRWVRLIVWIMAARKNQYSDTTIAVALLDFEAQDKKHRIENWWPYLDKVAKKAHAKVMQGQSEQYKAGDLTQAGAVLRKIASVQ